jgi:hypothetical protein
MKKILILSGVILVAALLVAGGFWGGMTYQTNQANQASQARTNFLNARGQANDGQVPGNGQFPGGAPGAGFFGGGGTTGQVKAIEGNVLTLSTAQDVATVNLSDATQIEKTASGDLSDLQPGTRVIVIGETGSDGSINASRIQILNSTPPDGPNPSDVANPPAAGTEP